jgi:hypothetical protein
MSARLLADFSAPTEVFGVAVTHQFAAPQPPQAGAIHSAAVVAAGAPPYIAPSRLQRGRFSPTGFICRATPARAGQVGSAADKRYSLGIERTDHAITAH